LLIDAGVVKHLPHHTILILPPKGANNQWWAEQTYKHACELGFPTLIVRPEQNAQEITHAKP
jgi:hypothetical protein